MTKHRFSQSVQVGVLCAAAMLASCHAPEVSQTDNNTAVLATSDGGSGPTVSPAAPPPTTISNSGPDMLSTAVMGDSTPLTRVAARQGIFAIENVDDVDTLTFDGKPVRYLSPGSDIPSNVTANDGISLVGVFELPQESVAWAMITGGTACAGTHVLVGARNGIALPGQEIPGCDDRGTMRKVGNKIAFAAGGSEGSYQDGLISVESKATKFAAAPQP